MKKGLKIFLVVMSIFIVIGGTSVFLIYYFKFNPTLFTPCEERPFTHYPVNMSRLTNIVPLGNLNPPGHTYPTDHMYFFTNATKWPDGFEIYAPGQMIITQIKKVEYDPPQVADVTTDYTIDFEVCSKISGRFGHVNNISTFLSDIIGDFGEPDDSYTIDNRTYVNYNIRKKIKVEAGQLLGRAGMGSGGYDFWLHDSQVTLTWVNDGFASYSKHTVCPLAYFEESVQTNLIAKIGDWLPVDPPGYCGKIDFDIPDTAQGIWAREGWSGEDAQERGLALVYSNFNTSIGAISIGNAENSTWDKQVYLFTPLDTGLMNRNFSQVTNDGNIYYYFCEGFGVAPVYTKVILIKMTGTQELQLQFVDLGGTPMPTDPTTLFDEAKAVAYWR
jgi:hypothetical protein